MERKRYLEIAALLYEKPKEHARILGLMTMDEFIEYERERMLWLLEQEVARREGWLH